MKGYEINFIALKKFDLSKKKFFILAKSLLDGAMLILVLIVNDNYVNYASLHTYKLKRYYINNINIITNINITIFILNS